MKPVALIAMAFLAMTGFAQAQEPDARPDKPLPSAHQEARAQALFQGVRCVVCQHESIADSPAGIAGDMRRLVRDEIAGGSSDAQVRADLVRRWGDYILFKPPVRVGTWLLWFGPFAVVAIIGASLAIMSRRRQAETTPLTAAEQARLDDLLQHGAIRPDTDASLPNDGR